MEVEIGVKFTENHFVTWTHCLMFFLIHTVSLPALFNDPKLILIDHLPNAMLHI